MAVHAQYLAHAFPHDHRAVTTRPALDTSAGAPVFLGEHGCGGHQLAAAPGVFSGITFNNNDDLGPRKRARVGLIMDLGGQRALLPPPVPVPQAFAPAGDVQMQTSRVLCSGAASTSGRPVSQCLLPHLYRTGVEIDALIRIETERLRAGLQEARRKHARAVASAVQRAAERRLSAAEGNLELALARNAELEERLRETVAEGHAWQGVAKGHEDVAAGLRATLDGLATRSPFGAEAGEGDAAEDARSCCFERERRSDGDKARACRSCGEADACVLLLPCRHLCLCGGCEAAVEACPVCAATKNASLQVLLS